MDKIAVSHIIFLKLVFRDLEIETSLFGQCLTRLGQKVDNQCAEFDKLVLEITSSSIEQELDAASDIPKHYRWTRKPAPTNPSPYILTVLDRITNLKKELQVHYTLYLISNISGRGNRFRSNYFKRLYQSNDISPR